MKNIFFIISLLLLGTVNLKAQNFLLPHLYSADPSGRIWPNDTATLWIYSSNDVPNTNHHANMFDYHVYATKDMVNWIDYGRVLSVDDVSWAISHAWAIDAVYWHNEYYLVYCMIEAATGIFRTGLATSKVPQGPFTDIGFIKGIEWGQDPCVFVDDDNVPYIYWGAGGKCFAARLADDLKSIVVETKRTLTSELKDVYEGPWVHKYKKKYYLSYPGLPNGKWPEEMYYAIADKPLGPYRSQGKYIPSFKGQSGTNHGSIVKFKGDWIALHHSAWLSNGKSEVRNIVADRLFYNKNGTIKTIVPDTLGFIHKKSKVTIFLEAENALKQGGKIKGTQVDSSLKGYSGLGYIDGFDVWQDYVEVLVQVAYDMKADLKIRLAATSDYKLDIMVGTIMLGGWDGSDMKKTTGWEEISLGEVQLKMGDNKIRFTPQRGANVKVDYFKIEPKTD